MPKKDELFLSTRPSVFQRTKRRNFDKQLADLPRLNAALRQPGHQAELDQMFDELSTATITTEKKYLEIAGTMTLDNLMIILGNKLDVTQQQHQNILYWTLHGFGTHFKKHPLFSKMLENLFRDEQQKHIFNNDPDNVAEIQSLNNFAEKIKVFLDQGPDSINDFFDKVLDILEIFSLKALQGFCLASKDFAKQCLQRSKLRKILCMDGNWIQALFDKYPNNLFITYKALAMKDVLREFNNMVYPQLQQQIPLVYNLTISDLNKYLSQEIEEEQLSDNIETLININHAYFTVPTQQNMFRKNYYSQLLSPENVTAMFAWADTQEKFTKIFEYLLRFQKDLLLTHDIFTNLAEYRYDAANPPASQFALEKAKHNCYQFIYTPAFIYKVWPQIITWGNNAYDISQAGSYHKDLTPDFLKKLYRKGNKLKTIFQAYQNSENSGFVFNPLDILIPLNSWFARGVQSSPSYNIEAGAVLLEIASVIEKTTVDDEDLKKFWNYQQPKLEQPKWYKTEKDASHIEKLKAKILAVAAVPNWPTGQNIAGRQQLPTAEQANVIAILQNDRYRRLLNFSEQEITTLVNTNNKAVISAVAKDFTSVQTFDDFDLREKQVVIACKQIADGIQKQKSFFRSLRSFFSIFSHSRFDVAAYVAEVVKSPNQQSQEFYLELQPQLDKYLTVAHLNKGFFSFSRSTNAEICAELERLIQKSPVFALSIAKNPEFLKILKTNKFIANKQKLRQLIFNDANNCTGQYKNLTEMAVGVADYVASKAFIKADDVAICDNIIKGARPDQLVTLIGAYPSIKMRLAENLITDEAQQTSWCNQAVFAADAEYTAKSDVLACNTTLALIILRKHQTIPQGINQIRLIERLILVCENANSIDSELSKSLLETHAFSENVRIALNQFLASNEVPQQMESEPKTEPTSPATDDREKRFSDMWNSMSSLDKEWFEQEDMINLQDLDFIKSLTGKEFSRAFQIRRNKFTAEQNASYWQNVITNYLVPKIEYLEITLLLKFLDVNEIKTKIVKQLLEKEFTEKTKEAFLVKCHPLLKVFIRGVPELSLKFDVALSNNRSSITKRQFLLSQTPHGENPVGLFSPPPSPPPPSHYVSLSTVVIKPTEEDQFNPS